MENFNTIITLAEAIDENSGLVTDIRLIEGSKDGRLLVDIRKKRVTANGDKYTAKGIMIPISHLRVIHEAISNAVEALDILEVKS